MPTVPCLLIPRFHRELISTRFQDNGWLTCQPWGGQVPAGQIGLSELPLNTKQAQQCLREWQNLDADLLQQELFRAANERVSHNDGMSAAELGALEAFVGRAPQDDVERRTLAQRLLLMVWAQEERILMLRSLNERYTQNAQRLSTLLADPDEPLPSLSSSHDDPEEARLLPPWRFVLRELQYFLPSNAVFGVADAAMEQELKELWQPRELTAREVAMLPEASYGESLLGVWGSCSALVRGNGKRQDSADGFDSHLFVFPVK